MRFPTLQCLINVVESDETWLDQLLDEGVLDVVVEFFRVEVVLADTKPYHTKDTSLASLPWNKRCTYTMISSRDCSPHATRVTKPRKAATRTYSLACSFSTKAVISRISPQETDARIRPRSSVATSPVVSNAMSPGMEKNSTMRG